jgi:hypothetical protein
MTAIRSNETANNRLKRFYKTFTRDAPGDRGIQKVGLFFRREREVFTPIGVAKSIFSTKRKVIINRTPYSALY